MRLLPSIDEYSDGDVHLQQQDLLKLASILIGPDGTDAFSIVLVHAHFALGEDDILVNRMMSPGTIHCKPASRSESYGAKPCAWFFENNIKQPFEFAYPEAYVEGDDMHPELEKQVGGFLEETGLGARVGIARLPPGSGMWTERQCEGQTIATYRDEDGGDDEGNARQDTIITAWAVRKGKNGEVELHPRKQCQRVASGDHEIRE